MGRPARILYACTGDLRGTIMRVIRGYCTNKSQPLTSPFPVLGWWYFALHGGDVLEPIGAGTNWFAPPYPKHVWHWFFRRAILPFFSWRVGSLCGYIGAKPYGVDAAAYRDWLCDPAQVYDGSQALCLTVRNGLTVAIPLCVIAAIWGILTWI
jgi:hypothetical protein